MTVGEDPTTGVSGIKVDNIQGFTENESFTITYTLCNTGSCLDNSASCGPLVSYKAGQCVYFGKAQQGSLSTGSNSTMETAQAPAMAVKLYPNPLMADKALSVEIENLQMSTTAHITVNNLTGFKVYEQSQAVSPGSNVIRLALPSLPSGTYMVSVIVGNTRYTKQLFIY